MLCKGMLYTLACPAMFTALPCSLHCTVAGFDAEEEEEDEDEEETLSAVMPMAIQIRGVLESFQVPPNALMLISVPAHFKSPQQADMRRAMQMAGISDDRIITMVQEPTSIAFGVVCVEKILVLEREAATKVLVVDIGGGTSDISAVEMTLSLR